MRTVIRSGFEINMGIELDEKTLVQRLRESEALNLWLGNMAPGTREVCFRVYLRWDKWLRSNDSKLGGLSPDEFIQRQADATGRGQYEVLDSLKRYTSELKGRYTYKLKIIAYIRSFYMHNRCELPRDKTMNIRAERPPVKGMLTPEIVKNMITGFPPVYQALFTCMAQAALDLEGLTTWNKTGWPELKDALDRGTHPIPIRLSGRKSMKNRALFVTYIGRDSIEAIKRYLPHRPQGAEAIFLGQRGEPLTKAALQTAWVRRARRLGLMPPIRKDGTRDTSKRYGYGVHELRDLWRTQTAKSDAKAEALESMMGHVIDPLGYNRIGEDEETLRAEYLEAEEYISYFSSGLPFHLVTEGRIAELEAKLAEAKHGQNGDIADLRAELEARQRESDAKIAKMEKNQAELIEYIKRSAPRD